MPVRDMLGYEVDLNAGSSLDYARRQFSFERENMYISYIERRNNAWITASTKDKEWYHTPSTSSHLSEADKKIYRRLYRGVFGKEEEEAPGHTLLLHKVRLGKNIDLVRGGVPLFGSFSRGLVWQLYSGALFDGMLAEPSEYSGAMDRFKREEFLQNDDPQYVNYDNILTDKGRTFASLDCMGDMKDGPLVRVLMAYSFRNPETGYSQSMNFIVTNLLLHTGETQAYWLLVKIIEEITPNYWNPDARFFGGEVDRVACKLIIEEYFPEAHNDYGPNVTMMFDHQFMLQMLLSLGNNILSPEMVNRVWDLLFHVEGVKILFRVIIITIRLFKDYVDLEIKEIGDLSQINPLKPYTKLMLDLQYNYDTDQLINMCFDETMKMLDGAEGDKLIDKFRLKARAKIDKEGEDVVAEQEAFNANIRREARKRTPILYKAFEWAGVDTSLIDVGSQRVKVMDQVKQGREQKPLPRGVTFNKIMQELSPGLMAVYKQFTYSDDPTFSISMIDILKQFVTDKEDEGGTPPVSLEQIDRETEALRQYGAFETKGRAEEFAQTLLP
tara:strand:+ start:853 stop:2517 length:1665 start_codon:yes stop_codon:yes gene_type:complete